MPGIQHWSLLTLNFSAHTMIIDKKELMWLAGIVDGDGCFYLNKKVPILQISMIDEDVIKKVSMLLNSSINSLSERHNYKKVFSTRIAGKKAVCYMKLLRPYVSLRRQSKIDEIFLKDSTSKNKRDEYVKNTTRLLMLKDDIVKDNQFSSFRSLVRKYNASHETLRKIANGDFLQLKERVKNIEPEIEVKGNEDWIMWLAGLMEAEGSFLCGSPSRPNCPRISIQMSDKDSIDKVAKLFAVSVSSFVPKGTTKKGKDFKRIFVCSLKNKRTIEWMKKLLPLMGLRRQEQIIKALNSYNANAKEEYINSIRKIGRCSLEEILEKRRVGLSLKKIGEEYGVSKDCVRRFLKKYSV